MTSASSASLARSGSQRRLQRRSSRCSSSTSSGRQPPRTSRSATICPGLAHEVTRWWLAAHPPLSAARPAVSAFHFFWLHAGAIDTLGTCAPASTMSSASRLLIAPRPFHTVTHRARMKRLLLLVAHDRVARNGPTSGRAPRRSGRSRATSGCRRSTSAELVFDDLLTTAHTGRTVKLQNASTVNAKARRDRPTPLLPPRSSTR